MTVEVRLLKAVWQVLWIEVISLLVWFIDCAVSLLAWIWKFNEILFLHVGPVLRSFTFIIRRLFYVIENHLQLQ